MSTTSHENHSKSKPLITVGGIWSIVLIACVLITGIVFAIVFVNKGRDENLYSIVERKSIQTQDNRAREAAGIRFESRTRNLPGNLASGTITVDQFQKEYNDAKDEWTKAVRAIDSPGLLLPSPTLTGPEPVQASAPATQPPPAFTPTLQTLSCSNVSNCVGKISPGEWVVMVDPRIENMDTGISVKTGETIQFAINVCALDVPNSMVSVPPFGPLCPAGNPAGIGGLRASIANQTEIGVSGQTHVQATDDGNIHLWVNVPREKLTQLSGNFQIKISIKP